MILKKDIQQKIELDFNNLSDKAIEILKDAMSKTEYLKTDRVIRCIVFLANGDIDKLKKYIDNATFDTRDVMLWAEYNKSGENFYNKRIRDFNKTFDNCTNDIHD